MHRLLCAVLGLLLLAGSAVAQKGKKAPVTGPPVLLPSKETVDAYMHHMLGYDPNARWSIVSIAESEVPGMALVVMRVGEGEGRMTQLYVAADGKHAIMGEALPFGADPFGDDRERLKRDAHGPSIGDANAPVTLVEFSDLQCPHCKAAQPAIDRLLSEVPAARLVFEPFPLEALHPWAFKAATYAQCVSDRKPRAFWTFIRSVYDTFFGYRGPWYTVGYRMGQLVEKRYGRAVLIECMADPRLLLAKYNEAAAEINESGKEKLTLWSPEVLRAVGMTK